MRGLGIGFGLGTGGCGLFSEKRRLWTGAGQRLSALARWWRRMDPGLAGVVAGGGLALALLLLFIQIADALLEEELVGFDRLVSGWLDTVRSPGVTALMKLATVAGSPLVLTAFALLGTVALVGRGRRRQAWALVASLVGGWGLEEILKYLFHRPRPPGPWLARAWGYSFPSGHSTVAVAFYGVLAVFVASRLPSNRWRGAVVALAAIGIALIGASRVFLGVHYPSDVAAGFAVGGVWGVLCILAANTWRRRR